MPADKEERVDAAPRATGAPERFDVFLSYDSSCRAEVERIARRLVEEGIRPWVDFWNLVPGAPWQEALERALAECASFAVFLGPGGRGPWQDEELRAAIDRRVNDTTGRFRVIPVLLPGVEREIRSRLPAFLTAGTWVEFSESTQEAAPFRRLLAGIRGVAPGPDRVEPVVEAECPYRGLRFFDVEHAPFFAGRERLVQEILWRILPGEHRNAAQDFVAIVGPSGSGKSSLARAGVLGSLKATREGEVASWPIAICRPGSQPLENLCFAVERALGADGSPEAVQRFEAGARDSKRHLHLLVRSRTEDPATNRKLVLLVDQFEETFIHCESRADREAFIANLLWAAGGGHTQVLVALRSDFYSECAGFDLLPEALSANQVLVGPMSEEELRRAVVYPAQLVGCDLEEALVDTLVADVRGQPGSLPLLQDALTELWSRRTGHWLTYTAYREIGRIAGALEQRAERIYNALTPVEKEVCRRILMRLSRPTARGEYVRRPSPRRDLYPGDTEPEEYRRVLLALSGPDARLLVIEGDDAAGGSSVDLSHEAILSSWSRLRGWLTEDRSFQLWRDRLEGSRSLWSTAGRHVDALLRGPLLVEAERWLAERGDDLSADERTFITESVRERNARVEEEEQRQRQLLEEKERRIEAETKRAQEQSRSASRLRRLAIGLAAAALVAVITAGSAVWQLMMARSRELAVRSSQIASADPDAAIRLAMEALGVLKTRQAIEALHRAVQFKKGPVFFPLGPRLTDVPVEQMPPDQSLRDLAYSSDGRYVATLAEDGSVRLWNADPLTEIGIEGVNGYVSDIEFSSDSAALAVAGPDGLLSLVGPKSGRASPLGKPDKEQCCSYVAFQPGGKYLAAAAYDGTVSTWDVAGGSAGPRFECRGSAPCHQERISSLAYDPSGQFLVTGSLDNSAIVWNTQTGQAFERFTMPESCQGCARGVTAVAISSGGHLAAGGADGKILLWTIEPQRELATMSTSPNRVESLAFNPDARLLASTTLGEDAIHLWRVPSGDEQLTLTGHRSAEALLFGPDGSERLTVASRDGAVYRFELDWDTLKAEALKSW